MGLYSSLIAIVQHTALCAVVKHNIFFESVV
jgi:hypothetical protein